MAISNAIAPALLVLGDLVNDILAVKAAGGSIEGEAVALVEKLMADAKFKADLSALVALV